MRFSPRPLLIALSISRLGTLFAVIETRDVSGGLEQGPHKAEVGGEVGELAGDDVIRAGAAVHGGAGGVARAVVALSHQAAVGTWKKMMSSRAIFFFPVNFTLKPMAALTSHNIVVSNV